MTALRLALWGVVGLVLVLGASVVWWLAGRGDWRDDYEVLG